MKTKTLIIAAGLTLALPAFSAQQVINIGTNPNDGTGDPLRSAFTKINTDLTDTYNQLTNIETGTNFTVIPPNTNTAGLIVQGLVNQNTNLVTYATNETSGGVVGGVSRLGNFRSPPGAPNEVAFGQHLNASNGMWFPNNSNAVAISVMGTNTIWATNNGSGPLVGIGKTNPVATLDVNGGIAGNGFPITNLNLFPAITYPTYVIFDGDSLTSGTAGIGTTGSPGMTYARWLMNNAEFFKNNTNIIGFTNSGVAGETMATMTANYTTVIHPLITNGVHTLLCIWGDMNDILAGTAGATIINANSNYYVAAKADGCTLVAFTVSDNTTFNAGGEIRRDECSQFVKTNGLPDYVVDTQNLFPLAVGNGGTTETYAGLKLGGYILADQPAFFIEDAGAPSMLAFQATGNNAFFYTARHGSGTSITANDLFLSTGFLWTNGIQFYGPASFPNTNYENVTTANSITVSNAFTIQSGSNKRIGTATANGTSAVAVSTTAVDANSLIFLTEQTPAGTPSAPYISSVTIGTGFSFKSQASDTSTVGWWIVEKQ